MNHDNAMAKVRKMPRTASLYDRHVQYYLLTGYEPTEARRHATADVKWWRKQLEVK